MKEVRILSEKEKANVIYVLHVALSELAKDEINQFGKTRLSQDLKFKISSYVLDVMNRPVESIANKFISIFTAKKKNAKGVKRCCNY